MTSLLIYGAGMFAKSVVRSFAFEDRKNIILLDKYSQLGDYIGANVMRPCSSEALAFNHLPVLNTVLGHDGITDDLHELGYRNVISVDVLFNLYPSALRDFVDDKFMWRDSKRSHSITDHQYRRILSLLTDNASRILFDNLLSFRSTGSKSVSCDSIR